MEGAKTRQPTAQELKLRQIAHQYLLIEQNTQYLTHILRWNPHRPRVPPKSEQNYDLLTLSALIVQLAYLLWTCHVKKINLIISQTPCLLKPHRPRDKPAQIFIQYLLEIELQELNPDQQTYIMKNFTKFQFAAKNPRIFCSSAVQEVGNILLLASKQFDKARLPLQRVLVRQLQSLDNIIKNYLLPIAHQLEKPQIIIQSFQQSELFRQHSNLVKVMNNSLFSTIRSCPSKNLLSRICALQKQLISQKINSTYHVYNDKIQRTLQQMLLILIKQRVLSVQQSLNQQFKPNSKRQTSLERANQKKDPNQQKYFLWEVDDRFNERRYSCKVLLAQKPVRQFNRKVMESLLQPNWWGGLLQAQNVHKNQILIEYISEKGLLTVRYITAVQLNIQNTDFVMYQCNSIPYRWSSVSMELVQKVKSKQVKRKDSYLAFKAVAYIHLTANPLFKLMVMMDLVVACAKIADPELKKTVLKPQDYTRSQIITQRVQHMIKLFVNKVENYYQKISSSKVIK